MDRIHEWRNFYMREKEKEIQLERIDKKTYGWRDLEIHGAPDEKTAKSIVEHFREDHNL